MQHRVEIRDREGTLLAFTVPAYTPPGLAAYSDEEDFVQVLSWNYEAGKRLLAHTHLPVPRTAMHTQEVLIVLEGRLRADIFDRDQQLVEQVFLEPGNVMVFLAGGHGYEIIENGTRAFEIKNGPYPGAERDRVRLAV
jgi:mannose-6-phosphate isomerase-like protein (cupin superfamily)